MQNALTAIRGDGKLSCMKQATITINNELEEALDAYWRDRGLPPDLTTVTQDALKDYLAAHGYLSQPRVLRITPADKGSGETDISQDHDRYFAAQ